jgi:hypothetical protein
LNRINIVCKVKWIRSGYCGPDSESEKSDRKQTYQGQSVR